MLGKFEGIGRGGALGVEKVNSASTDSEHQGGLPIEAMYCIGLDVHKRKIRYSVKDSGGKIFADHFWPRAAGEGLSLKLD